MLGSAICMAAGRRGASVTVSMTSDFLSSGRLGDWLEAHVRITKWGRRLVYATCDLRIGTRHVMHASGVFALHEPMPKPVAAGAAPS
jgi:acyl-coenzyme A thioesterase PaaI-like protein